MKKLYIVGRHHDNQDNNEWDFQGVFSSEEKAVSACRDYSYFVGPANLDEELPNETGDWPNLYYPIVRTERDNASTTS